MISVENPCGKNVSKFQDHICCRYKVINHRECAFLPFSNIVSSLRPVLSAVHHDLGVSELNPLVGLGVPLVFALVVAPPWQTV